MDEVGRILNRDVAAAGLKESLLDTQCVKGMKEVQGRDRATQKVTVAAQQRSEAKPREPSGRAYLSTCENGKRGRRGRDDGLLHGGQAYRAVRGRLDI